MPSPHRSGGRSIGVLFQSFAGLLLVFVVVDLKFRVQDLEQMARGGSNISSSSNNNNNAHSLNAGLPTTAALPPVNGIREKAATVPAVPSPTPAPSSSSVLSWPPGKKSACDQKHPTPQLMTELTQQQRAIVKQFVKGKQSYLEWGAGGSSDTVPRLIDGPAFSIDNHPDWCYKVQKTPYVACRIAEGSMTFACVDTGAVKMYGNPANPRDIPKFANYVKANEKFPLTTYDVVFDDGRSRTAVAFQAHRYMHEESLLIVHDWPEDPQHERYPNYSPILNYFERVNEPNSNIGVFKKKSVGPTEEVYEKQLLNYH